MDAEIITENVGQRTIEANLAVAVEQGRIGEGDKDRWRRHYQEVGYEAATKDLISRKIAARNVAPSRSYSEQAWDEFATRCNLPGYRSGGYHRSVV
jgi:hypothetical protein